MSIPDVDFAISEEDTFSQWDSAFAIKHYVCGVCYGELEEIKIPGDNRVFVICPDHGSVCRAGRVTRNTVSIKYEMASSRYNQAIKNVSEWACLVPPAREKRPAGVNLRELGF
jgi:hypothetical protein